jgi:hypothetical protein
MLAMFFDNLRIEFIFNLLDLCFIVLGILFICIFVYFLFSLINHCVRLFIGVLISINGVIRFLLICLVK